MDSRLLETYRRHLRNRWPFLGTWLRRRAQKRLLADGSPAALRVLADELSTGGTALDIRALREPLRRIANQRVINLFCTAWATTRSTEAAELLTSCGWVPSNPPLVRVLTALKVGRLDAVTTGDTEVVEPLLQACQDVDSDIASRAIGCLPGLTNPDAIDTFCSRWFARREPVLTQALIQAGYVARKPPALRVWTALKVGRLEVLTSAGAWAVPALLQACGDTDTEISGRARQCLLNLQPPEAVAHLCSTWVQRRDPLTEQIILQAGYVPEEPATAKVLTALKLGKRDLLIDMDTDGLPPLVDASRDKDPVIAEQARLALGELRHPRSREVLANHLCAQWTASRSSKLAEVMVRGRYVAAQPLEVRVLSALKTGQQDLLNDQGAEILPLLIASCEDRDPSIAEAAQACLAGLRNREAVDALCASWVKDRSLQLTQVLLRGRYIARQPTAVRVLTALKLDQQKLLDISDSAVLDSLLSAYNDYDPDISQRACSLLQDLQNPNAIDAFCARWAATRDPVSTRFLEGAGYIAQQPLDVRVLTALKVARIDVLTSEGAEVIAPLVQVCTDNDPTIAQKARECLASLMNPAAIDALCQLWTSEQTPIVSHAIMQAGYLTRRKLAISGEKAVECLMSQCRENDSELAKLSRRTLVRLHDSIAQDAVCRLALEREDSLALEVALEGNYAPRDVGQRALFLFLTRQWERYESLDFDCVLLRAVFQAGDDKLRRRIADTARQTGRVEWARVVIEGRLQERLERITDAEWNVTLEMLASKKLWNMMWQMAQQASARWSARLLLCLASSDWLPEGQQRLEYERLVMLAKEWSEPSFAAWPFCQDILDESVDSWNSMERTTPEKILANELHEVGSRDGHTPTQETVGKLSGHQGRIQCLTTSPDGSLLVTGGIEGSIRLWRLPEHVLLSILNGHLGPVRCLAISPNARLLASGGDDATVRLWRLPDGQAIQSLAGHRGTICRLSFSIDGSQLVSWSSDKTKRLWVSGLASLASVPIREVRPQDIRKLQREIISSRLNQTDRRSAGFMFALYRWCRRFDVQIDEVCQEVSVGEFDIEVEG